MKNTDGITHGSMLWRRSAGVALVLAVLSCSRHDERGEARPATSAQAAPAEKKVQLNRAQEPGPARTAGAPVRLAANVAGQAEDYAQALQSAGRETCGAMSFSNMLALARGAAPYDEARQAFWDYARTCRSFTEAECVASALWERAASLEQRHEAMVILGYAALWRKEYDKGIAHLNTIVREQEAQAAPSARHVAGAYQNLSTLYGQQAKWEESVQAAQAALAWWEREAPERRTCSRAGVETTLAEALANAGRYAEAEALLEGMMQHGAVHSAAYGDVLHTLRFYKNNPTLRDWSRPVLEVTY